MTVLIPYDGSEQSQFALEAAADVFSHQSLLVLHVIEPFADHTEAGGFNTERYDRRQKEANELLADAVASLPEGVDIETETCYGRPIHEIVRFSENNPIDEIVMGSHGREGAKRLLLGSVAETVLRRASVPVTVVREKMLNSDTPGHVVVPFDGSAESRDALTYALEQYPDADITALYVQYPPHDVTVSGGYVSPSSVEDWSERIDEQTRNILDSAVETAQKAGQSIQTATREGDPAREIVEYVETESVDHVVMGSHGRDGLTRLLLGSVAETVVRRSPTSVTVVR